MDYTRRPQPVFPVPRRAMTAPTALQANHHSLSATGTWSDGAAVETLYSHPDVKIISFAAAGSGSRRASDAAVSAALADAELGTLSWSSRLERIIAVGPFRMYRAPGSVAFLSCGSALQPILPKSQCWCIDEANSKFVLQIRRPNYWRIELPVSSAEDQKRARDFRDILDGLLEFEKTQCPFQRPFTVVLPEQPNLPVKKRPWAPARPDVQSAPSHGAEYCSNGTASTSYSTSHQVNTTTPDSRGNHGDVTVSSNPSVSGPSSTITVQVDAEQGTGVTRLPSKDSGSVLAAAEGWGAACSWHVNWCETAQPLPPAADQHDEVHRNDPGTDAATTSSVSSATTFSRGTALDTRAGVIPQTQAPSSHHDESLSGPLPLRVEPASAPHDDPTEPSQDVSHQGTGYQNSVLKPRLRHTASFDMGRSFTSPPQLTLVTFPPSKFTAVGAPDHEPGLSAGASPSGSQDSFHSVPSWTPSSVPLPPALPVSHPELCGAQLCDDDSGMEYYQDTTAGHANGQTVAADSQLDSHIFRTHQSPDCEVPEDDRCDSTGVALQRTRARHRAAATSNPAMKRAMPPFPPRANLSNQPQHRQTRLGMVRRLPISIIAKTCEILLGPPSHLIALMLKVASKICAGEWSGRVDGYGEGGEHIPVQWDYSNGEFSDWTDDDEPLVSQHQRCQVSLGSVDGSDSDGRTESTARTQSSGVD
ncbi:hypothetical protein TOPH_04445 [Tolypocladium ophioglossoides CBS 100239]|uniref:Inheritance of peroxisomes protein 1 n=1 Tax=Tolypocladium ophioglossoides (strain CBS 100239) TaxID=1163406 RepID=A0A0L0NAI7_TOLOC|nr:hypothetical protein TOPH_04445 [Tolypocladium ophioglossoides CBS 100239]